MSLCAKDQKRDNKKDIRTIPMYLDGGKNDGSVRMSETRGDTLARGLRLAVIFGSVAREAVEDENLTPFCALVQGRQKLVDG